MSSISTIYQLSKVENGSVGNRILKKQGDDVADSEAFAPLFLL